MDANHLTTISLLQAIIVKDTLTMNAVLLAIVSTGLAFVIQDLVEQIARV